MKEQLTPFQKHGKVNINFIKMLKMIIFPRNFLKIILEVILLVIQYLLIFDETKYYEYFVLK